VLDRKLVSIHSGDRDFNKWPNSNEFGVDLGVNFNNVQSMRLINFAIPVNHYTFSDYYQNTKLSFTYTTNFPIILRDFSNNVVDGPSPQYNIITKIFIALFDSSGNVPDDIGIQWFSYKKDQWVNLFSNINAATTTLEWNGDPFSGGTPVNNLFPTINDLSGSEGLNNWADGTYPHKDPAVIHFRLLWKKKFTITIPEGSYSPNNLCQTLQTLMNKEIYNASAVAGKYDFIPGYSVGTLSSSDISNVILSSDNTDSHWYQNRGKGIKPFAVYYNEVTNKIMFGVNSGTFTLHCGDKEEYSLACNVNKHVYEQHVKWGLASYLGFQKKDYHSEVIDISGGGNGYNGDPYQANEIQGIALPFEGDSPWLTGGATTLDISGTPSSNTTTNWSGSVTGEVILGNTLYTRITNTDPSTNIIKNLVSFVDAEYNLNIHGEDALYMEVEKYNNIDEMYPYSKKTSNLYNNDLAHRANGSFARIPLTHLPFGQELGSRNNFVLNVFHTDPPIKKIDRLKFKFRYHDGRLVDFKNLPFSFTLEFNMLKDEQVLGRSVRVPTLYNL
jgi:hypothetical protein